MSQQFKIFVLVAMLGIGVVSVSYAAERGNSTVGVKRVGSPAITTPVQAVGVSQATTSLADLTIDSIRVIPIPQAGDRVEGVTVTIRNKGEAAAVASQLKVSCQTSDGKCPMSLSGQIYPVQSISAMSNFVYVVLSRPGEVWGAGNYQLAVELDAGKMIAEKDENNNTSSLGVSVKAKPIVVNALQETGRILTPGETQGINPQPEPPRGIGQEVQLNPQPEPPAPVDIKIEKKFLSPGEAEGFNPQPEPPGKGLDQAVK